MADDGNVYHHWNLSHGSGGWGTVYWIETVWVSSCASSGPHPSAGSCGNNVRVWGVVGVGIAGVWDTGDYCGGPQSAIAAGFVGDGVARSGSVKCGAGYVGAKYGGRDGCGHGAALISGGDYGFRNIYA